METPSNANAKARQGKSSPRANALTDWTFFGDSTLKAREETAYLMTLRLESNRADTFEQRMSDFVDQVNRTRQKKLKKPKLQVAGYNKKGRGKRPPKRGEVPIFSVVADAPLLDALNAPVPEGSSQEAFLDNIFVLGHGMALPADAVGPETARDPVSLPNTHPKPGMVITAVIDTGIPFLNEAFMDGPNSTRVRFAWVQDGKVRPQAEQFVPHGREFDRGQINTLLQAGANGQPVRDELALYRDEGLADFTRKHGHSLGYRSTHGGYVASAAAGYPISDAKTDHPIIFVQLPDRAVADSSGETLEPYLVAAIDYIFDRADRIAAEQENCGQLPLVMNFSFGGTGGPLDGTSTIETFLDQRIKDRNQGNPGKTALVLPAGNAYLSQCHAKCSEGQEFKGAGKTEVLTWQVQPDDHTASFIEIWTPSRQQQHQKVLEVGLTRPYDNDSPVMLPETPNTAVDLLEDGEIIGRVVYEWVGAPTNRGKFTVIAQATARPGHDKTLAPAGPWKVTLKDVGLKNGDHVDAWILRDDELPRFDTDSRQSYFTDPRYRHWTSKGYPMQEDQADCPIKRDGLQNALATGEEPVVIGAYLEKSGKAAIYTAGGPTNGTAHTRPDAMAVSDDSWVHWGVMQGMVLSGGKSPANGTSIAAPAVARKLAEMLAGNATAKADRQAVKQLALTSEASDFGDRAPQPPAQRSGHGRIQLTPQDNRRYQP